MPSFLLMLILWKEMKVITLDFWIWKAGSVRGVEPSSSDLRWIAVLVEISPGISLEGMMLKLKLQYFGHLMQRVDSLEKTLMLGGIGAGGEGDDRGWDGWMASPTQWMWAWVNSGSWWWTGRPGVLQFMGSLRVRHSWATELYWTDLYFALCLFIRETLSPVVKQTKQNP